MDLPTVFVKLKGDKAAPGRLINESDFDESLHTKVKAPADKPAAKPDSTDDADSKE